MKKINLRLNERFGIRNLLSDIYAVGGLTLENLSKSQKLIQKISIDAEFAEKSDKDGSFIAVKGDEAKKIKLKQAFTFDNEGRKIPHLFWDSDKDVGKEIEFSVDEISLLKDIIEGKDKKKEFKLADNYIVELAGKLGISIEK